MTRAEFMRELAFLLQDLPEEERQEAIYYYEDYFDEAGSENEEDVIEELQSPERVAAMIKDGLNAEAKEEGEFSERGFSDDRFSMKNELDKRTYLSKRYHYGKGNSEKDSTHKNEHNTEEEIRNRRIKGILILVVVLLAFTVIIPTGFSILGVIFGCIAAVAGVLFAITVASFAIAIAGIVVFGVGIAELFINPAVGMVLCGAGLILFSIGLALAISFIRAMVKVIPPVIRTVTGWIGRIFHRRRDK